MQVTNKHFSDCKRSTVILGNRLCANVWLTICAQMFQCTNSAQEHPIYWSTVCEQTDSKRSTKIFVNRLTSVFFCYVIHALRLCKWYGCDTIWPWYRYKHTLWSRLMKTIDNIIMQCIEWYVGRNLLWSIFHYKNNTLLELTLQCGLAAFRQ